MKTGRRPRRGYSAETGAAATLRQGRGYFVERDADIRRAPQVPGLFVALILRFDATRAGARRGAEVGDFASPVFLAVLASYAGGLVLTLYIMTVFDAAQPALLYLVPATLLTSLLVAACRGEASTLAAFSEEEENDAPPSAGPGKSNGGATTPRRSPRLAAKSPSKEN